MRLGGRARFALPVEARGRLEAGVLLVECLVYIGVSVVVLGLAFAAFFHVWKHAHALRRMSADTVRTLQAGERWREDVRNASAALRLSGGDGGRPGILVVPQRGFELTYVFTATNVVRTGGKPATRREVLSGTKASRLVEENRRGVSVWRWEVELRSSPRARLRPLFTFLAVEPAGGGIR